jgi:hypothetical protein
MQKSLEPLGFAEYEILILENQPLEEKADHESCPGHAQYPTPHCFWLRGIHHYLSYRQIKRILSRRNRIGDPGTGISSEGLLRHLSPEGHNFQPKILQNQETPLARRNSSPWSSSSREARWWVSTTRRVSGRRKFCRRE